MPLRLRQNEGLKGAGRAFLYGSGVRRQIRSLRFMQNGTLRTIQNFTTPLTPTISPAEASGFARANGGGARATTNTVRAIPNGGTGPYTYQWAITSGRQMIVANQGRAETAFSLAEAPGVYEAVATCTVTDGFGQVGVASIYVTITIAGFGGGPIE